MATMVLLACWLAMILAPATPVGRMLHQVLVVAPATWLSRITRGQVVLGVGFILGVAMLAWLGGADGLRIAGMAAPELTMAITSFEISTYVDMLAMAAVLTSTARLRGAVGMARATSLGRLLRRPRGAKRARRTRKPTSQPANDDDRRLQAAA